MPALRTRKEVPDVALVVATSCGLQTKEACPCSPQPAELYSPLFLRYYHRKYNIPVTVKGLAKRRRGISENIRRVNKMATLPATAIPAAAMPAPEWKKNLSVTVICPECKENPPNLEFPDSHETVCGSCGLVLADREIDMHSEWRTFSNDDQNSDDPSRVGDAMNPLLNGNQLETSIASGGSGRSRDLYRAQNKQSSDKANKQLLAAYKEIGALCDGYGIQKNVSDTTKYLYKLVDDAKAFKGKSQDAVIAGCLFIACRRCNVSRTFSEIHTVTKVSKKEIGRIFKSLNNFFKHKDLELEIGGAGGAAKGGLPDTNDQFINTATNPSDLCNRYCNLLELPYQVSNVSASLSDRVSSKGDLAGRSPLSVVGACIYMASYLMGHGKPAREISAVVHVSDGTIRGAYKQLYADRDALINPDWIKNGKGDMANLPVS